MKSSPLYWAHTRATSDISQPSGPGFLTPLSPRLRVGLFLFCLSFNPQWCVVYELRQKLSNSEISKNERRKTSPCREKKSFLSLPEQANHERVRDELIHLSGVDTGPSFNAMKQDESLGTSALRGKMPLWLNASSAQTAPGEGFVTRAAREMTLAAHWKLSGLQGCKQGRAGAKSVRIRSFLAECDESTIRNRGVQALNSTVTTNNKAGLLEIPFLAENANLARVINLMSYFLVTSLCICESGCVVKKWRPQIFQQLFGLRK